MAPTVLAECRPNLRACYVFIKNVPNASESSVEVEEQRIFIRIPDEHLCVVLPPILTLVPGCISGQTFANCTLTFRTRIDDFSPTTSLNDRQSQFSPNIHVNDSVSINCDFCNEHLIEEHAFSRVLPLPSSEEPNDFFCHRSSDDPVSLDPKPSDFFYNYFFFKIHVDDFKVPPRGSKFNCPKCLELLGEVQGKCVKLWNSVVSFSSDESSEEKSIDKFVKSFAYFVKNLPVQMNKFVFLSSHGSSTHYTLIWIMDRTLVILEGPKESDCFGNLVSNVHLEPKKVMKVLYSHHDQLTEIAEEWMKSFNTSIIPIHPRIESRFVNYLKDVSGSIPDDYVDGMGISYLDA